MIPGFSLNPRRDDPCAPTAPPPTPAPAHSVRPVVRCSDRGRRFSTPPPRSSSVEIRALFTWNGRKGFLSHPPTLRADPPRTPRALAATLRRNSTAAAQAPGAACHGHNHSHNPATTTATATATATAMRQPPPERFPAKSHSQRAARARPPVSRRDGTPPATPSAPLQQGDRTPGRRPGEPPDRLPQQPRDRAPSPALTKRSDGPADPRAPPRRRLLGAPLRQPSSPFHSRS